MLGTLRDAAGSWLAKGLLSVLVLSFAVWGISGRIEGAAGHDSVITVGDTAVSVNENWQPAFIDSKAGAVHKVGSHECFIHCRGLTL